MTRCVYCNGEVDPDRDYQYAIGWVKRRDAGGTNALALRTLREKYACQQCVNRLKRGVSPQQARLI